LQNYLDTKFAKLRLSLDDFFLPRIKDIIIDTFLSAKRTLTHGIKPNTFELFGFDFLIDEDFRVWLLEVNTNPYLGTPNDYLRKLVPEMLSDMLKIVVDPVMPPKVLPDTHRRNDFELVYFDARNTRDGVSINQRR